MFGVIVLTVDVGQLLFKRRAMVNASDAAALAAAQSCANLGDTDIPGTVANTFAQENVSVASGGITELVGCDGPAFGHVSVEYGMDQSLFFAGVLGANGPARVATRATAGWGPAGAGHPIPVVVYEGDSQGGCDIKEDAKFDPDNPPPSCYMWYDNDLFQNSAFGFLNLCTANDPCQQGWDVGRADTCPSVGASLRDEWISGTWSGSATETNYPADTFVCRVSGVATSDWSGLSTRKGDELLFPVNDCLTQVDKNGVEIGCGATVAPDKYNIVGFIVLRLEEVYQSAAEWGGVSYSHCSKNQTLTPGQVFPLSGLTSGQCPSGSTPSGVENLTIEGQAPGTDYTYDDLNKTITWTGPLARNARFEFDWWLDGKCGRPPGNASAVCLVVTPVEARFRGTAVCESCKDFGTRAVQLCDLAIGSCPKDAS